VLASLQWIAFTLANVLTVPVVLGQAFGMSPQNTATYLDQTLIACGIIGILQVLLGHKYPIIEGPAGTWWGVTVVLVQMTKETGGSLPLLLRQLEWGLLAAGVVAILLAVCGLLGWIRRLFTPIVTGTFMLLLSLQLSRSMVAGILGIGSQPGGDVIDVKVAVLAILLIAFTVWLMVKGRGLIKSLAVLIGLAVGWAVFAVFGLAPSPQSVPGPVVKLPALFPWGPPDFHAGIVVTCAITMLVLMSNLITSVQVMGNAMKEQPEDAKFVRGTLMTGVGTAISGAAGSVGLIPLSTAASLVALTGIRDRLPFLISSIVIAVLGMVPSVGQLVAAMPAPVGYAVMFAIYGQLLGFGLQDFKRLALNQRDVFVVGIAVLSGVGIFFVPSTAWRTLPPMLAYLLDNGLIVGVALVVILEYLVFRKRDGAGLAEPESDAGAGGDVGA
jgi:xanthine/uracil permease